MTPKPHDNVSLAAGAARVRAALTALVAFLAFVLIAERAGYAGLFGPGGTRPEAVPGAILVQMALAAPAVIYLCGLWQLRQAAAAAAQGGTFDAAIERSLRRVGYCLMSGAALALLGMPILYRLAGVEPMRLLDHDVATLIIAGIGLGLVFLARLVGRAATIQAELDQIF